MPWYVLVIGAAIVWFLIMKGAEWLGRSDKPSGKTMEEKYRDVCRKAHFPPENDVPKFVSQYANVALCSSHIIVTYLGQGGQRVSKVFNLEDITSINTERGFEKGQGGIVWGALLIHCADGRDDRFGIPSDEIDTFMATYEVVMRDLAEMLEVIEAMRKERN